jgi:pSer/pThr/pTyr-binding forkhead associated (FHA) protein
VSFVVQRVTDGGLVLNQIGGTVLRIGRGTNAEVRSENPAVGLEHALIEEDAGGFTVTDKGSVTGTYVNAKPVETVRLFKGDVIEIGDLRIEVQLAEAGRPLFLRILSTAGAGSRGQGEGIDDDTDAGRKRPVGGAVHAPKIDFASAYRLKRTWLTKRSLVALAAIAVLTMVTELMLPGKQAAFMPGGLSSAHARAAGPDGKPIANDCHACHDPWRGVVDARCSSCHQREPHSLLVADEPPCISCHAEHRGMAKLAAGADWRCASCHSDLTRHVVAGAALRPDVVHIEALGEGHPAFTYPADGDTLRFNHRLHLQPRGIFNGSGRREVLACSSCHALVESRGKADPTPVRFAADCQRCHKLTFDPRFPDAEVPHGGDPGLVYGFILATYAGRRDVAGKSPDELRRILTTRAQATPDERAVLNAEQVIKTKCTLCHELRRVNGRLAATQPVIRARWLEHVKFTHGTHRNVDCEACHGAARRSAATSDVLMPRRDDCVSCHAAAAGRTATPCVTCHEYHERSKDLRTKMAAGFLRRTGARPPASQKQRPTGGGAAMLGTILLFAIVLLLLVVLVPVGLAIYQRLRVGGDGPRRDVPETPSILSPTVKVPPLVVPPQPPAASSAAAPAPPPPSAAVPPVPPAPQADPLDMTRIQTREEDIAAGGTEMVQWYGMLVCTSGPLEGQRWIVEDEGFYIGRDVALSQVVIADSRVSKRHVRIVPRDGRAHAIDQGSTNGTFLGKATSERITDVQLKRGDIIVIADNVATFLYQI